MLVSSGSGWQEPRVGFEIISKGVSWLNQPLRELGISPNPISSSKERPRATPLSP